MLAPANLAVKQEKSKPLVSVGVPVFNGEPFIRRALESLLALDYPALEIIISDNASTDNTFAICKSYADCDARIRLMRQSNNIGAVANFRAVLDQAKGRYFMWAAADDSWHPRFVTELANELQAHPQAVVAMCAVSQVLENGLRMDSIRFCGPLDPNQLTGLSLLRQALSPAKFNLFIYGLFRARVLQRAMTVFPETLGGDRQFISHLTLAGNFRYVDEVLHTRTHQSAHHDDYLEKSRSARVKLHQIFSFGRMLFSSPVVPPRRKLLLPIVMMHYFVFLFRNQSMRLQLLLAAVAVSVFSLAMVLAVPLLDVSNWVVAGGLLAAAAVVSIIGLALGRRVYGHLFQLGKQTYHQLRSMRVELRYLGDLVADVSTSPLMQPGNELSTYLIDRHERLRKALSFVHNLEKSRIRELYLQEIFPDIGKVELPVGAVNEMTGHPNKTDMLFVCAIAKHVKASELFEFGTYQGRTTYHLTFASENARVTSLNLPPEADPVYGKYIGQYFKSTDRAARITQVFCDSRKFDTTPLRGRFDFVFVDGDHSYEGVKDDTLKAFELIRTGGVIMWHDYAPKSGELVRFFQEFTQTRPLFRIRNTCLLLHINGIDPMTFKPIPMDDSLELQWLRSDPYSPENIYHS